MTFNSTYKSQRNVSLNKYSKSSTEGFKQGLKMAGKGLWDGISGIVYDPYKGAKKHGVTGFAKGAVKGLLGVGIKPVVGVLDLMSKTTEGLQSSVKNIFKLKGSQESEDSNGWIRLPRVFGENGELLCYDNDRCLGNEILYNLFKGKYYDESCEMYSEICTMNLDTSVRTEIDYALLLTRKRIMLLDNEDPSLLCIVWEVPYRQISKIQQNGTNIQIMLTEPISCLPDYPHCYLSSETGVTCLSFSDKILHTFVDILRPGFPMNPELSKMQYPYPRRILYSSQIYYKTGNLHQYFDKFMLLSGNCLYIYHTTQLGIPACIIPLSCVKAMVDPVYIIIYILLIRKIKHILQLIQHTTK